MNPLARLVAVIMLASSAASAQMPQMWARWHEGQPCRLIQAADGDLIVAASVLVPSDVTGAFYDSLIARYSPEGTLRWMWQSNESQNDRLADIALAADGTLYAVGEIGTSFWGQAPYVARVMKFSSSGQRMWSSTYTPARVGFDTDAAGVRVAPDGSITIFGQDYGVATERDVFIARFSAIGAHQWTYRRAGPIWDFVHDLVFDEDSNAYWTGSTSRSGTSLNGGCIGKLTPGGQEAWLWRQPVIPNVGGGLGRLSFDRAGELVASGLIEHFPGYQDGMLLKLSREGTQRFYTLWNGPDGRWDRFFTHAVLTDNTIVASGDTYAGDGWEYYDVPTIRFSPEGDVLWSDIYGGTLYAPNDTEEWSLNMFALAGDQILTISTDWARPGYDYALHRYSRDGQLLDRAVRELAVGDIKDIPVGCAAYDQARSAVYLLGWGSGFPGNPVADHLSLVRIDIPVPPHSCPADFDADGFVTGDDFDAYVAMFEAGSITSDFDQDGFVTGDDFDAYVAAFEEGC